MEWTDLLLRILSGALQVMVVAGVSAAVSIYFWNKFTEELMERLEDEETKQDGGRHGQNH